MGSTFAKKLLKEITPRRRRYLVRIDKLRIHVATGVYPPGSESFWIASYLLKSDLINQSTTVLDYGCGGGILSLTAATLGAKVTAIDINPAAVQLTRRNAKNNGLSDFVDARLGSGMEAIAQHERFSVIIANIPFENAKPNTWLQYSVYDHNHRMRKSLFDRVTGWDNFAILFIQAQRLDLTLPLRRFSKNMSVEKKASRNLDGELCHLYEVRPTP